MLSALRGLGVKNAVMLTGDSPRTAAAIAAQLGVDDFQAGVLPADKADYVAVLRREGHTVLMVGDGINDSPALSEAMRASLSATGRHRPRDRRHHHRRRQPVGAGAAATAGHGPHEPHPSQLPIRHRVQRALIGLARRVCCAGHIGHAPQPVHSGRQLHSMRALPLPKSGQRF